MKGNARSSGYDRQAENWYQESAGCVDAVIAAEGFDGLVYDPAAGEGNIPRRCAAAGINCIGSDVIDRGAGFPVLDFLAMLDGAADGYSCEVSHVLCNPPFDVSQQFVERALDLVPGKVVVLQRLAWLEGQKRRLFFERTRLSHVWVHSSRISMPPGGQGIVATGGAVAYAWYVWRRDGSWPTTLSWLA